MVQSSDSPHAGAPNARSTSILGAAFGGSVALAALAVLEALVRSDSPDILSACLAGSAGAALGASLAAGRSAMRSLSQGKQAAAWTLAGAGLGLLPAVTVGAIAKLAGPHRVMAGMTLVGSCVAGGLLGLSLQLITRSGNGRSRTTHLVTNALLVLGALFVALAAEVADELLLVLRTYPPLRTAMTVGTWLLVSAIGAAVLVGTRTRWTRLLHSAWFAALGMGLGLTVTRSADQVGRLLLRPTSGLVVAMGRSLTDFDRDGSSSLLGGGDCAPFDPKVNPSAREIPGNGIDDNCRFGDPPARREELVSTPKVASPAPLNVLLVTIDTLRADHVGSYGYSRPTTPHLDAFAERALRFTHAYTSGGWTCLAVHSLMAGAYPRRFDWQPAAILTSERVVSFPWETQLRPGESWMNTLSEPTRAPANSLPSWLGARGMRVVAAVASTPAAVFRYEGWFERNFERSIVTQPDSNDEAVADAAIELLRAPDNRPFFLWAHFFEPHEPYEHHPGLPIFGDELVDRYDHDVAFADEQVGRLLDAVAARTGRETAIIVAADHGETFVGGFPVHGADLQEDSIRIPLLLRGPGIEPGVTAAPASLVDIAPTIYDWTATPRPPDLDGVSLLHAPSHRIVLTDIWRHDRDGKVYLDLVGATGATRRLVRDQKREAWYSYRVGDYTRPPVPLHEPPDPALSNAIGRYLEETGVIVSAP